MVIQAEQLLDSKPDSALVILDRIQADNLHPRSLRARYAVLLTAAQHKNYIDVDSDSLIGPAYDHFRHYGSLENRMKAAYYCGIVKQNAGQTVEASYLFNEAFSLAESLGEKRYLGFACEHLSTLYSENYDSQSAYEYAQKAAAAFDSCGETLSADYSRLDMARSLYSLGKRGPSERIVDSLLASPNVTDLGLRYYLYGMKADFSFISRSGISIMRRPAGCMSRPRHADFRSACTGWAVWPSSRSRPEGRMRRTAICIRLSCRCILR